MTKGLLWGALPLLLVAPALAQVPSMETQRRYPPVVATPPVPPPPPLDAGPAQPSVQRLLRWMPGEVRCDNARYPAAALRRPWTALVWGMRPDALKPIALRFRIDPAGRTLGIERIEQGFAPFGDDVVPSLASTRFAAGPERRGCTVSYQAEQIDPMAAPFGDLVSYSINPMSGPLPRPAWDRLFNAGGNCVEAPRPGTLNQAFPDFTKVEAEPGTRDWVFLGYDLDAAGKPVRVKVLTSTGNRALDAAGVAALERSRYTGGPRTGCHYHFWKGTKPLAAPTAPPLDDFRPTGSTCTTKPDWRQQPTLVYPDNWRRRGIEGWAVIAYDVAPWGATGNVRVLAAEPAAEFGDRAAGIIRGSMAQSSTTGVVGCVERVAFRMGPDGEPPRAP